MLLFAMRPVLFLVFFRVIWCVCIVKRVPDIFLVCDCVATLLYVVSSGMEGGTQVRLICGHGNEHAAANS